MAVDPPKPVCAVLLEEEQRLVKLPGVDMKSNSAKTCKSHVASALTNNRGLY